MMNPVMKEKSTPLGSLNHLGLLVLFALTATVTSAQEVWDLSYCIRNGLEQNFNLRVVRNTEEAALNNYSRGNAGMLPDVSASNRFGGTLNSTNRAYVDGTTSNLSNVNNLNGSAGIDLDLTIFKGFRVQRTYEKLGEQAALEGLKTQLAIENLVASIVSEYNYYLQQLTLYDNLAYAVLLSRERVRIDEQRYLLGSASRMHLLQSIVYLNADSSRVAKQDEVLRSSEIRLKELMAVNDMEKGITLKDTLISINQSLNYDSLLFLTLENNTSLKIASKNRTISELDYEIIRSASYPYLTFSSGYGYTYNGYGSGELLNQQVHGMNYGVTLGIDIFQGFNRRREQSNARIEIKNKQLRIEEVEQSIRADLHTIYYAYENNLQLMRLEEQNLKVAQENLEIALERYKLGSLAGLELREVQKSLLDAEERLISVKYQIKLAEISLLQISGQIMTYL
jgi:outer membrane protein TolC